MFLRAQGIDNNGGSGSRVRRARGLSNNDGVFVRGRGIDDASKGLETMTEADGARQ